MKEKWTAGKTGGCVVSDTPNRHGMADDHVDYYGGYLVAESIPKQEYIDLIAAALDLLEACEVGLDALVGIIQSEFQSRNNPRPADDDPAVAQLRAAIAKAQGGNHD